MTRDEQKKLNELKRKLSVMLKEKAKTYKFKKKDYMIWMNKNELFYTLLIGININTEGQCICSTRETIKPLWVDDLLWEFLKMPDNKNMPFSLRAVGAFTVRGTQFYEKNWLINWDVNELEKCVNQYFDHFYKTIQVATIDDFYLKMNEYAEISVTLSLIYEEKYQETLNYLQDKGKGQYCNGEIWINNAIREYCIDKVSLEQ